MKRFILLALVAAFVMANVAVAGATDLQVKGELEVYGVWGRNFAPGGVFLDSRNGGPKADGYNVQQRMRNTFTFVTSENLKAVWGVEIGTNVWGSRSGTDVTGGTGTVSGVGRSTGFGLDGDGVNIETRWAYLDFTVPGTTVKVTAGLQPIALPHAMDGSAIEDDNLAALVVSTPINDMVSVLLGYGRPADLNQTGETNRQNDEVDLMFLAIPFTPKGFNITPFGAYALAGRNTHDFGVTQIGTSAYSMAGPTLFGNVGTGLIAPITATSAASLLANASNETTLWWAGLAFEMTMLDPFVVQFDFNYGSEKNSGAKLERKGWLADAAVKYKGLGFGTPTVFGMYSSGEDSKNDKSERMPYLEQDWIVPGGFWFGGSSFGSACNGRAPDIGQNNYNQTGVWTAGAGLYEMTFLEGLTHDLVVMYIQGTNNKGSVPLLLASGQPFGTALTTKDHLIEVDFNHQYKIYEQLQAIVEFGIIIPDYDKATWSAYGITNNTKFSDAWRVLGGLKYKF